MENWNPANEAQANGRLSALGADRKYLRGYRIGAVSIKNCLHFHGWARTKGFVKQRISLEVKPRIRALDDFFKGYIDALLDSVN